MTSGFSRWVWLNRRDDLIDTTRHPLHCTCATRKMSGTKRHRIRAHVNPLAVGDYVFPLSPDMASWNTHYPYFYPEEDMLLDDSKESKRPEVTIADVGCGFGGLSVTLSRTKRNCFSHLHCTYEGFLALFPSTLILAMEIRDKVVSIVQKRIASLREETKPTDWPVAASCIPPYSNVFALSMSFLLWWIFEHVSLRFQS